MLGLFQWHFHMISPHVAAALTPPPTPGPPPTPPLLVSVAEIAAAVLRNCFIWLWGFFFFCLDVRRTGCGNRRWLSLLLHFNLMFWLWLCIRSSSTWRRRRFGLGYSRSRSAWRGGVAQGGRVLLLFEFMGLYYAVTPHVVGLFFLCSCPDSETISFFTPETEWQK